MFVYFGSQADLFTYWRGRRLQAPGYGQRGLGPLAVRSGPVPGAPRVLSKALARQLAATKNSAAINIFLILLSFLRLAPVNRGDCVCASREQPVLTAEQHGSFNFKVITGTFRSQRNENLNGWFRCSR